MYLRVIILKKQILYITIEGYCYEKKNTHCYMSYCISHFIFYRSACAWPTNLHWNSELRHWFEQMQCKKFIAEREEQRKYHNQFPKVSQEKLDRWLTEKEREIKENQAKYRKEQEQQALKWSLEYVQKNRHSRNTYLTALKKDLKNSHRNKYNPQIKTIECYPPRLLLEWKK